MIDHAVLAYARSFISYLPVALYAESLRLNSALVHALGSNLALPIPLTGCVKDLGSHLASVAPAMSYPTFVPTAVLRLQVYATETASLSSIKPSWTEHLSLGGEPAPDAQMRQIRTPERRSYSVWLSRMIAATEVILLSGASILCFLYGLIASALLLLCLATNTMLLLFLQRFTTVAFANMMAIEKDRVQTAAHGAALDVHVVVEDWNALDMDVIIGYSSQLHALTNIPVRINRWRAVKWITRLIGLVLIVQASLLASLMNSQTEQAWGSFCWLASYLLMLTASCFVSFMYPDMLLSASPAKVTRLKPIAFLGRKAAMVFIATMPGIHCKYGVGRWDWMDGFMPNNERRRKWLSELTMVGLEMNYEAVESGSIVSEDVKRIITQVQAARNEPVFRCSTNEFMRGVGLHD